MPQNYTRWASIFQLTIALIGLILFWGTAFLVGLWGITEILARRMITSGATRIFLGVTPLLIAGALLLPSIYYPIMRLRGKPAVDSQTLIRRLKPELWVLAIPAVIISGYFALKVGEITWFVLPLLHGFAIGLPVAWILYLGIRQLPKGSSQRLWGVFGSGMALAPLLIMILEVLAGVGLIALVAVYLSLQPGMAEKLLKLLEELRNTPNPDTILNLISPYLTNRLVIIAAVFFVGVIVPMVEELIKPIGVWLLAGRKITPAGGFAAGALSGAGYGFIESLILSSTTETWTSLVVARIGTSSVHILTTALMGWAIVQTWQGKHYRNLAKAYLCAVLIHGLWNGLTVLYSFQTLAQLQGLHLNLPLAQSFGAIAPIGLVLIAGGCFFGLIAANRFLRSTGNHIQPKFTDDNQSITPLESML